MNVKIVGIGKCGSRLCYDFFARVRGLPVSYEMRMRGSDTIMSKIKKRIAETGGIDQLIVRMRVEFEKLTGTELLKDQAFYAIADSDLNNNEVAKQVFELRTNERIPIFPGQSHELAGLKGGCQFHFISENYALNWANGTPDDLLDPQLSEVFAYAFSVGGGTGGGASPILARRSRKKRSPIAQKSQIHYMGIAILPKSDEDYFLDNSPTVMDDIEKFNTGRFFTSWYGKRQDEDGLRAFDGVWMVSNDLLRFISDQNLGNAEFVEPDVLKNKGLSLVNGYVANCLCTICNASSLGTRSSADIDARELNINLAGHPYITAYAYRRPDSTSDSSQNAEHLQDLFRLALSNASLEGDALQGLSMPVSSDALTEVQRILCNPARDMKELDLLLTSYKARPSTPDDNAPYGPDEFWSARRVVMFYGQPEHAGNQSRKNQAERMVKTFFPNSEWIFAHYDHPGESEYLLLMIVRPILPAIVSNIFHYISLAWLRKSVSLTDVVTAPTFDVESVTDSMHDSNEAARIESILSDRAEDAVIAFDKPIAFTRDHVVAALAELQTAYNWKKPVSERFPSRTRR